MKKVKEIIRDNKVYLFLIITLAFFGAFLKMDFATDTYSVLESSKMEIFNHFLLSGRAVTAIFWGVMCITKIQPNAIYLVSFAISIVAITVSLYKVYKLISEDSKNEILNILLSIIIIINPFSIELFMYIEKGILTLAVLLCVYAVEFFVKFMKKEHKIRSLILAFVCMLIATFSYQGVLAIFVALSSIYILKYSKTIKQFIINNMIMLLTYGIPAIINLFVVRMMFTNDRVSGKIIISETIEKIIAGTKNMIATYNIMPKYLFAILITITLLIFFIMIIRSKNKIKSKIINILEILYVIILATAITIAPQALQNTASIWFVARSTYAFASLIGLIMLTTIIINDKNISENKNEINNKLYNTTMIIICIVLLVVQFYEFNKIELDHYNMNYLDRINSQEIGKVIKEYEDKNGIKITKICVYQDKNTTYKYPGIFATGDINITGFAPDWSIINMINYYNNLKLEKTQEDETIKQKFKDKDWNNFNSEEIIIEDNTIHFCKF